MDLIPAHQGDNSPAINADLPALITAEVSNFSGVPAYTLGTTTTKSRWIKSAVLLSKHRQSQGEFSRYQLGENFRNGRVYTPPIYLTQPDPERPILKPRNRRGQNYIIRASQAFYREWLNRDWDAALEFLKTIDLDNEPDQPVIRIAD